MKWVLILLIFPTWTQTGKETHFKFETEEQCRASLTALKIEREHYKVCARDVDVVWTYKDQEPKK